MRPDGAPGRPRTGSPSALAAYQELKRKRGVIDLDDLLALMVRELTTDQLFADSIRWRFRHVHVDEAQDLNPIQFRLLELIVGTNHDLYLVGDPAQAIFGFNGADPSLLSGIADRLQGVEVIRLPTNHRCTPQIVAAGSHVLRAADAAGAARAARADGAGVRVVAADDETHEASLVAAFVRSLDPADVRNGRVAVIARTHEQLSRLERVLRTAGLPVHRVRRAASTPIGRLVRQATALPSATRLRAWALDVLDQPSEDDADIDREARVTVATAVLDFLREQPAGDGVALRWWLSTAAELMPVETRRRAADVPCRQGSGVADRHRGRRRDRSGPAPFGDDDQRARPRRPASCTWRSPGPRTAW